MARSATFLLVIVMEIVAASPRPAAGQQIQSDAPAKQAPPPTQSAPSKAELRAWADQLDDDNFATRRNAQRRLEAAGQRALEAVAVAANSESLEASARAVEVLLRWSESPDHEFKFRALEQLAKVKNRPVESALAQDALDDVRQLVALTKLKALGAKILRPGAVSAMRGRDLPLQIVIGPKWTGVGDDLALIRQVHTADILSFHSAAPLDEVAIERLMQLQHIARLEFYGTPVAAETVERLRGQQVTSTIRMPGFQRPREVDVRPGGALLGIRGGPIAQGQGGAVVGAVNPGGAAARGGLQSRDRIVKVDGQNVADFMDLTQTIGDYNPGDDAVLSIIRQGKPMTIEVTFDRWGDVDIPGLEPLDLPAHDVSPVTERLLNDQATADPRKTPRPAPPEAPERGENSSP